MYLNTKISNFSTNNDINSTPENIIDVPYTIGQLPSIDMDNINNKYHDFLQDIRPLNENEKLFFSNEYAVNTDNFVQTLYRVKSKNTGVPRDISKTPVDAYSVSTNNDVITPLSFKRKLRRFMENNIGIRTSYFITSTGQAVAVVLNCNLTTYSNTFHRLEAYDDNDLDKKLNTIMISDRHIKFNLDDIFLPRIRVFKISSQEYAILVTQPQIIADYWKPISLLKTLLHSDDINNFINADETSDISICDYITQKNNNIKDKQADYWKKYLSSLSSQPKIPGYHEPNIYKMDLRTSSLKTSAKETQSLKYLINTDDKTYWIALLSTIWGLTLQALNKNTDNHFPAMLPIREVNLKSYSNTSIPNALILRINTKDNLSIKDLVKNNFAKILGGQSMGYTNIKDLMRLINNATPYNHILNFLDFDIKRKNFLQDYLESGIQKIASTVGDINSNLTFNFRYNDKAIELESVYNENAINANDVNIILQNFHNIIKFLPDAWDEPVSNLISKLNNQKINTIEDIFQNNPNLLVNYLQRIDLFSEVTALHLNKIAVLSRIHDLPKDEVVQTIGEQQKNMLFILKGKILRYREGTDGWLNPLNVVKSGDIINEFALINPTSNIFAEVASDNAIFIAIPIAAIKRILNDSNNFGEKFSMKLLKELDKYQKRWMTV